MFCPECGKQIPDDSIFCPECGLRINEKVGTRGTSEPEQGPVHEATQKTTASSTGHGKGKLNIIYIAAAVGVLALAIVGFFVFKNVSGKDVVEPEPEDTLAVASEETTEDTYEEPVEDKSEFDTNEEVKEEYVVEENPAAVNSDMQEESNVDFILGSGSTSGTQETFDEDYPQGLTEEVELTDEDLAHFAERLSTTESAKALDFEWFIDYVNNGGTGPGKFLKDSSQVFAVTGNMTPILNGGWKCFMFTKSGDYGSDVEQYCNADITIEGEKIYITINYDTYHDGSSGESHQDDTKVKYKGTIDPVTGKATVRCDDSMIEIDNFFSAMDIESEYAVGTFHWISGEIDQFGLMREYFP